MSKKNLYIVSFLVTIFSGCSQTYVVNDMYNENLINENPTKVENRSRSSINARQFNFPSSNYVMVGAHRAGGFKHGAPENSLSAIQHALDLGVDIIEIDVRLTLDHELVVLHDKTLERTTNGKGKVSHHKLKDIKKLFLKDANGNLTSERVPTLKEALEYIGDEAIVFIDKAEYLLGYVSPILVETKTVRNVLFMDFIAFEEAVEKYKGLLKYSYYVPGVHDSNPNLENYVSAFEKGLNPNPSSFAFWFKDDNSKALSLIKNASNSKIPVWVSTTTDNQCAGHTDEVSLSNPDNGWGWVLNQGANILFTDEPEALINYLKDNGLRQKN